MATGQQPIVKMAKFLPFFTYLTPILELPSVNYLQTWQYCENCSSSGSASIVKKKSLEFLKNLIFRSKHPCPEPYRL